MTPSAFAVVLAAAVLWSNSAPATAATAASAASASASDASASASASYGPTLAEMTAIVEPLTHLSAMDLFGGGTPAAADQAEGRKKKPKPAQMAMVMAGAAAGSMMVMKMIGAIKLFIIHSFFATKLGLIIGAYLLVCKLMEMKEPPVKKTVKWVSPPSHYDEHPSPSMMSNYPEMQQVYDSQQSYEPHQEQQQQQQQQQQPSDQYGPPPSVHQQFMPSGDFGGGGNGGGDMQAHYSHVSPVTYRPMINRNQPDGNAVKSSGRIRR